jgi:hypothetical protein
VFIRYRLLHFPHCKTRRYSLTHVYKYLGSSVLTLYQRQTAGLSSKCSAQHCKSRAPGHIQKHEQRTPHVLFVWNARYRVHKCPSMDPTPVNKNLVKFTKHLFFLCVIFRAFSFIIAIIFQHMHNFSPLYSTKGRTQLNTHHTQQGQI